MGRFETGRKTSPIGAVHPHACGEITHSPVIDAVSSGTSPRLWGDYLENGTRYLFQRYIPTLVGRLVSFASNTSYPTVHPHACGEINAWQMMANEANGTSPRLWGDSGQVPQQRDCPRYIPTLVGRFLRRKRCCNTPSVHPHACGEIMDPVFFRNCQDGTSPRLWGDSFETCADSIRRRYIPTLVGRFVADPRPRI